jgi:hypothetical protein
VKSGNESPRRVDQQSKNDNAAARNRKLTPIPPRRTKTARKQQEHKNTARQQEQRTHE